MKSISSLEGYPQSMIQKALISIESVLDHAGIDYLNMSGDEMQAKARSISARCNHDYNGPYKAGIERKCRKCGGIQSN